MAYESTRTNFFSDAEVELTVNVTAPEVLAGRVTWQLTALHRTIARGDALVKLEPDNPTSVNLRFRMPHVKEGVVHNTLLTVSFTQAGQRRAATTVETEWWVFAPDPFADRTQWLEQLELQLFDPGGATAKLFRSAGIPFAELRSVGELKTADSGLIIVAEGVKRSEMAETLVSLAAAGRNVLWFAPTVCELQIPGSEEFDEKLPKELAFRGSDRIEQLDKRLDPNAWSDPELAKSVGFQVVSRRGLTNVEVADAETGWSWVTANYGDPDAQFILCGLGLIDAWDASPTPRYLLLRLLEQLDPQREANSENVNTDSRNADETQSPSTTEEPAPKGHR
ncbi:MAG: hypothetical protein HKN47_13030 [Pirellulaceae bacterium]|nr:hypothetical protein [Pirellulaceae bacterium]